jgi:hypothetical protein
MCVLCVICVCVCVSEREREREREMLVDWKVKEWIEDSIIHGQQMDVSSSRIVEHGCLSFGSLWMKEWPEVIFKCLVWFDAGWMYEHGCKKLCAVSVCYGLVRAIYKIVYIWEEIVHNDCFPDKFGSFSTKKDWENLGKFSFFSVNITNFLIFEKNCQFLLSKSWKKKKTDTMPPITLMSKHVKLQCISHILCTLEWMKS